MTLEAGRRLGPYEVDALIGAGGMGEVYRARDTKLGRAVALKVLPESLAADPERRARFEREARTLAALSHPNIAIIHGVEDAGGTSALVLELVEGPTLADRITAGPIPVDDTIAIARQIADALQAAHEQGVIHRDLKPANIKLRHDGTVKVLDFGLAKLVDPLSAGAADATVSPTITSPAMTAAGMILGTAAYMSPEQAKGRGADKRSDIWAFGCVLYEMLTGERAFAGEDVSETIASVLRSEPDWSNLPADVPPALRTLLEQCLVKDRRKRVSDIAAAQFVVENLSSPGSAVGSSRGRGPASTRWLVPAALAAAATALIAGVAAWIWWPRVTSAPAVQFAFTLTEGQFTGTGRRFIDISPDGTKVVYVADSQLFLRRMDAMESRAIQGSRTARQGLVNPMFSPDGESIAFLDIADGALKKIPVSGGGATTIVDLKRAPLATTWDRYGILLTYGRASIAQDPELQGIFRVSPDGGVPERIAPTGRDEVVTTAQLLPDGRNLLLTVTTAADELVDESQVVAQSIADGKRTVLVERGAYARYFPTGHLLYAVSGSVFAIPFDAAAVRVTGAPVPVIEGVARSSISGSAQYAVSASGSLAYVPGPKENIVLRSLIEYRAGQTTTLKVPQGRYSYPRVSRRNIVAVERQSGTESDIWAYDLSGDAEIRRVTFGGNNQYPIWSADGERITFQSRRENDRGMWWQPLAGGTAARLTRAADGEAHIPESWSPDGRFLLFSKATTAGWFTLWVLGRDGMTIAPFGAPESAELFSATFSPDGRWVAYAFSPRAGGGQTSDRGVYVERFPSTGEKYQAPKVVLDFHPVWAPDGKRIVFISSATAPPVEMSIVTTPTVKFQTPVEQPGLPRPQLRSGDPRGYDIAADGRFISVVQSQFGDGRSAGEIRVILNWREELLRRVPTK